MSWQPQVDDGQSRMLDFLRAVGAVLVLVGHARTLSGISAQTPGIDGPIWLVFLGLTSLGHEAVIAFFVVSGFLVGGRVVNDVQQGEFSMAGYLAARGSRLYSVLAPALVLGCLFDLTGLATTGSSSYYWRADGHLFQEGSVASRLGIVTFVGNGLYLQPFLVRTFGSNGPLWSLGFEWWYYVLFPMLLICSQRVLGKRLWLGVLLGAGAGSLLGGAFLSGFSFWMIGAFCRRFTVDRLGSRATAWGAVVLGITTLAASRFLRWNWAADWPACVLTAGLLLLARGKDLRMIRGKWVARIAESSYSIYALHFPLIACVSIHLSMLLGRGRLADKGLVFAVSAMAGLTFGVLLARPMDRTRPWYRTQIQRLFPAGASAGRVGLS